MFQPISRALSPPFSLGQGVALSRTSPRCCCAALWDCREGNTDTITAVVLWYLTTRDYGTLLGYEEKK